MQRSDKPEAFKAPAIQIVKTKEDDAAIKGYYDSLTSAVKSSSTITFQPIFDEIDVLSKQIIKFRLIVDEVSSPLKEFISKSSEVIGKLNNYKALVKDSLLKELQNRVAEIIKIDTPILFQLKDKADNADFERVPSIQEIDDIKRSLDKVKNKLNSLHPQGAVEIKGLEVAWKSYNQTSQSLEKLINSKETFYDRMDEVPLISKYCKEEPITLADEINTLLKRQNYHIDTTDADTDNSDGKQHTSDEDSPRHVSTSTRTIVTSRSNSSKDSPPLQASVSTAPNRNMSEAMLNEDKEVGPDVDSNLNIASMKGSFFNGEQKSEFVTINTEQVAAEIASYQDLLATKLKSLEGSDKGLFDKLSGFSQQVIDAWKVTNETSKPLDSFMKQYEEITKQQTLYLKMLADNPNSVNQVNTAKPKLSKDIFDLVQIFYPAAKNIDYDKATSTKSIKALQESLVSLVNGENRALIVKCLNGLIRSKKQLYAGKQQIPSIIKFCKEKNLVLTNKLDELTAQTQSKLSVVTTPTVKPVVNSSSGSGMLFAAGAQQQNQLAVSTQLSDQHKKVDSACCATM